MTTLNVLVALHNLSNALSFHQSNSSINKAVIFQEVTDFNAIVLATTSHRYQFIVIITRDVSATRTWKVEVIEEQAPVMIIAGGNMNPGSLDVIIDSIRIKEEVADLNPLFKESLLFIEQNLCDLDLSLERVASQIYVSKCHYSRLFQKNVGIGFKEYVMNKRIQKAKMLLQKGEPVTDVCYSVGYGDLTHFGRVFKRLVGVNPSAYRSAKVAGGGA